MNIERSFIGRRFWLRWVLFTILGYSVGYLAGFVLGFLLGNVTLGVGIGAGVGFMQWVATRRFIKLSVWWVVANILGLTACLGLYAVVHNIWGYPFHLGWPSGVLGWVLAFLVGGILIGLWQHLILRNYVYRSGWWVLVCAVGWALSVFGLAIPPDMSLRNLPFLVLILRNAMLAPAVAGVILGTLTGISILYLYKSPVNTEVLSVKNPRTLLLISIIIIIISLTISGQLAYNNYNKFIATPDRSSIFHPEDGAKVNHQVLITCRYTEEIREQKLWIIINSIDLNEYVPLDLSRNDSTLSFSGMISFGESHTHVKGTKFVLYLVSASLETDSTIWNTIKEADQKGIMPTLDSFPTGITMLDSVRILR
jgi:hypothetical protein